MAELLHVDKLWAGYGDAVVLENVSFTLNEGDSLSLLGRNGMGKTTLLSTLMGAANYRSGVMRFAGQDLSKVAPHARAHLGLGWVPQERDIFASLSVEENLTVVATKGPWDLAKVYAMFPRLQERRLNLGNQLSGGEQQMLALGRALMLNPKLLLLDEPLEGLAPLIVQELLSIIQQLTEESGMAVILVEQHARQILPLTRQALVLERGKGVYQGPSQPLLDDSALLDSWLGVSSH
ncbi:MAG: ABC transporter ATP-binding protein [Burkholderiales bacterium]|jgi:branched-chain amino acid transport system ATP-binding protein|nr:ABC transporter ATP-binding protein [Burkholderiales bacterium]